MMIAILIASAVAQAAAASPHAQCRDAPQLVQARPTRPRRLDETPPASLYLLVQRRDADGCLTPLVVRSNIGRDGQR